MSQTEIAIKTIKPGREGWVYLVHAEGTNRYKIGRSVNPILRAKDLEKQSPYPLKLLKTFHTPDCVTDEEVLHRKFDCYRVHGEWFELPTEKIPLYLKHSFYSSVLFSYREFFWRRYSKTENWLRYQKEWADGSSLENLVFKLVELTVGQHNYFPFQVAIDAMDSLLKEVGECVSDFDKQRVFFVAQGILFGILGTLIMAGKDGHEN